MHGCCPTAQRCCAGLLCRMVPYLIHMSTTHLFVIGAGQGLVGVDARVSPARLLPSVQEGAGRPVVWVGLGTGHDLHAWAAAWHTRRSPSCQCLCPFQMHWISLTAPSSCSSPACSSVPAAQLSKPLPLPKASPIPTLIVWMGVGAGRDLQGAGHASTHEHQGCHVSALLQENAAIAAGGKGWELLLHMHEIQVSMHLQETGSAAAERMTCRVGCTMHNATNVMSVVDAGQHARCQYMIAEKAEVQASDSSTRHQTACATAVHLS